MAASARKKDPARDLAVAAARIAHDDNCKGIVALDLRGVNPVTDYFVIATGSSDRQMRAVADHIKRQGALIEQKVWHVAGYEAADWIVMDFVDVVVHLFDEQLRRYYDLEIIWGEAPKVDWRAHARRTGKHPT